eukprot:GILI01012431.1.p1 GENE.GILI01012431.1~~GILI01012431.1.p1  ORF type:complete len:377 (+),score=93.35 GILI01012431.1:63-1133(+)
MWFVKDLTEFANEARNMLTGEQTDQQEGGESSHASPLPQPQRRKAGGNDTEDEKMKNSLAREGNGEDGEEGGADGGGEDKVVLVGYDANGVPLFENANSEIGAQYVEAQKLVDQQVIAEEKEDEEHDDEESDDIESNYSDEDDSYEAGSGASRKSLLAVIRLLKSDIKSLNELVATKENNEQRLQSIVTAQQRKIKLLEEQLLATKVSEQTVSQGQHIKGSATGRAETVVIGGSKTPQKQDAELPEAGSPAPPGSKGNSISKLPPPPPPLTSNPPPFHPSTSTDSSVTGAGHTNNATPARATTGSSGYESWEDVGQNASAKQQPNNFVPPQHVDPQLSTCTSTNNAAEDEDWANFV